jgi:TM2 domain-containing membrane protein YozV
MRKSLILLLCIMGCYIPSARGSNVRLAYSEEANMVVIQQVYAELMQTCSVPPDSIKADTIVFHKKHRLIAALLAFPIPCGIFGLHRVYMHTAPAVPFVYVATAGGLFGVLPFIDFVLILLNKDIHLTYTSNPHIFMWQKR